MKYLVFFLFLFCMISCGKQPAIVSEGTLIKNVSVLTMPYDQATNLNINDVLIEGNKIVKIGKDLNIKATTTIDGSSKYLMPGLTEMHAHIPTPREGDDSYVKETLFLYLSQGITTIRGMLGDPYHLTLKKDVADGKILGPRIYTSSPSCNGNSIPDEATAIEKVTAYQKEGYDFLKIHPGIKLSVWEQLEKTAKEVGIGYAGHVPVDVGVNRAIAAGYGTIDHLDGYLEGLVPTSADVSPGENGFFGYNFTNLVDTKNISELVQKTKAANVSVVLTQTLFTRWFSPTDAAKMLNEEEMKYMPAATRFTWRQGKTRLISDKTYNEVQWQQFVKVREAIIREMNEQDVTFLLGSDAPQVMNVPGFSLHHEMQDMADIGISNDKILRSGTIGPARYFQADEEYGTIEEGKVADMILLSKNPSSDISNASSIDAVFVKGQLILKAEIDKRLAAIAATHEKE